MTDYTEAPTEVIEIAQELIDAYHPHLKEARIGFIMRETHKKSKGKSIMGTARKPPAWLNVFEELDFIIELAEDIYAALSPERRRALIDHELCHCGMGEQPYIKPHDIEEFTDIIERYGDWSMDIMLTRRAFQRSEQKTLEGFELEIGHEGKVVPIQPGLMNQKPLNKEDHHEAHQPVD